MSKLTIYPSEYMPIVDCKTFSVRAPLPLLRQCPICPCNFFTNAKEANNCNLCPTDPFFWQPFVHGDIIPLQVNFNDDINANPELPTVGWVTSASADGFISLEILDENCEPLFLFVDEFATDYYVYYSERCNAFVQTAFIDTGAFDADLCTFSIRVTTYGFDEDNNRIVTNCKTSEPYRRTTCGGIEKEVETCVIESTYKTTDCFGRCYCDEIANYVGTSPRQYYNSIRVPGAVSYLGDEKSDIENSDGEIEGFETTSKSEFRSGLLPPYFQKCVSTVFCGDVVNVNGQQYERGFITVSNIRDDQDTKYNCLQFGLEVLCAESSSC